MTRVYRFFEGLLLILFGGLMVRLVESGDLWWFLNPKFEPIIGMAGSLIIMLGIFLPFNTDIRPSVFRTTVWTAFLLMASMAVQNADDPFSEDSTFATVPLSRPEPVVQFEGSDYRRVDMFELYLRSLEVPKTAEHFAVQGMVIRTPELDAQQKIGIVRIVITCCLADAVAVGFTVKGHDSENLNTGQWVEILGTLVPVRGTAEPIGRAGLQGVVVTTYSEKFTIQADELRLIPQPAMPYIF